jgi:hypothetical protein
MFPVIKGVNSLRDRASNFCPTERVFQVVSLGAAKLQCLLLSDSQRRGNWYLDSEEF